MCSCDPTNFDAVIVRDMADKNFVQKTWPEHDDAEFIFLKDAERKLNGWIPTHIYFSVWCQGSPDFEVISPLLSHRRSRGSRITCLGS